MLFRSLLALALLSPSVALASTPVGRGVGVAAAALGGELAGGIGGGLVGGVVGGSACRSGAFECLGAPIGIVFGGSLGSLAGAPIGGALGARGYGVRPGRVVAWSLAGAGVGLGVAFIGLTQEVEPLAVGGVVGAAVAMPLLAGLAAGSDHQVHHRDGPVLSFAPSYVDHRVGLQVAVAGF
jgi:hypothetical protein